MGLYATAWLTPTTWVLATVQGKSMRDWIKEFVYESPTKAKYGLIRDYCHGINCVDESATETNSAQELFELDDTFVPLNPVFRIIILGAFVLLIFAYILRLKPTKLEATMTSDTEGDIEEGEKCRIARETSSSTLLGL